MLDRIFAYLICAALGFFPALASAQSPVGAFPPGAFQNRAALTGAAAPTYQGPGDVVSGATVWGSCARVYSAAQASTSTSLCDLVDSAAPTTVICTLRGSSTGFVDLAGTYCTGGVTPSAKCAAATGAKCNISKIYDQAAATGGWTQATAANQPSLLFSALNSLPGIQCGSPATIVTAALTLPQPYSLSTVYIRTSGTAFGVALGSGFSNIFLGADTIANQARLGSGTNVVVAATDAAWHSFQGTFAAGSGGAANIDGTDTGSLTLGTSAFTSSTLRFCADSAGSALIGRVMEGGLWPSPAFNATQRGNISTNQHSANGYNF